MDRGHLLQPPVKPRAESNSRAGTRALTPRGWHPCLHPGSSLPALPQVPAAGLASQAALSREGKGGRPLRQAQILHSFIEQIFVDRLQDVKPCVVLGIKSEPGNPEIAFFLG